MTMYAGFICRNATAVFVAAALLWPISVHATDCKSPVKFSAATLARQIVVVGELHGTNEQPQLVASILCSWKNTGRNAVFAIEASRDDQATIDEFVAGVESADVEKRFRELRIWDQRDGRGSEALWRLALFVRDLRARGANVRILAMDIPRADWNDATMRERRSAAMAERLISSIRDDEHAVVLIGNFHARRSGDVGSTAFGDLLPSSAVRIRVGHDGGTAWNCRERECRSHEVNPAHCKPSAEFDACVEVGTISASPPVRR
ncbi:hypothetical protein [Roseiterribacter gracilis]|uniref:hypothetical protein n=1 Tax=Roseiterribacter gracilis TaxID=2812848 RepID=UPI003B42D9AF